MAETHGWGTVTENPKGSGDPNVLVLGDQSVRIRLVEPGAVKWRQHSIESPTDAEQFRSVVCPRGEDGRGDMPCPLCMKPADSEGNQRFGISRRNATNVWVYKDAQGSDGEIKVLVGGPQIFKEFDAVVKMGIDPTASDWTIFRMGQGKQTSYKLARHDSSPFAKAAEVTPDKLHDLDKYASPPSIEAIFKTLEEVGIDYDSLEMPSFTLDKAESFQMPYGQHKGMTIEQLYVNDKDYLLYIYNSKREQGSYGDPVFVAMHTVLEHYGDAEPLDQLATPTPKPAPSAAPAPTASAPAAEQNIVLVGPNGEHMEAPASLKDTLLAAGYTLPEPESTPEPEAPATEYPIILVGPDGTEVPAPDASVVAALTAAGYTVKQSEPEATPVPSDDAIEPSDDTEVAIDINGTSATMLYGQAKALIAAGAATLIGSTAVEATAVEVPEPGDDEQVTFKLRVMPSPIPMPYKDAKRLFQEGQGDFVGDNADVYRGYAGQGDSDTEAKAAVQETAATDQHPPAGSPSNYDPALTVQNDDGSFRHPALTKTDYKTKGAVTQALNKLKGQGEAPAASNGGTSNGAAATGKEALMQEVRDLLAKVPSVSSDFNVLMELFQETGGKRNINEFDEAGLNKLKTALQEKVEANA